MTVWTQSSGGGGGEINQIWVRTKQSNQVSKHSNIIGNPWGLAGKQVFSQVTGVLQTPSNFLPGFHSLLFKLLQTSSVCPSLCLWFPHASKNPPLCPYLRKIKSHAWMTGGPLLWHPSSASVLRSSSETTSALCCLPHWTHYNLHTAETVPQTTLLPSPCTLLSPTWKIRTPMWGCCSWIIVQHLTP